MKQGGEVTSVDLQRVQDRAPTAEDFSGRSIEKYVARIAMTHPATWGPLGIAVLAGIASVGATSAEGIIGAVILTVFGLGHGVFKYFIQGENIAERRFEELRARLEKHKQTQLHGLLQEFSGQGFNEGSDVVNRLVGVYRPLSRYLKEKVNRDDNSSAARFLTLVENTYEQGLLVVKQALVVHTTLRKINPLKLEKDLEAAKEQLENLSQKEGNGARNSEIQSLSRKVKSCEERLKRYHKNEDILLKMLEHGEQMIEALENASVDVAMLVEKTGLEFSESDAAKNLERHIKAAQKVDDMLSPEEDNEDAELSREVGQRIMAGRQQPQDRERS